MILDLEAGKIEEVMESSAMVLESCWGQETCVRVIVFARRPQEAAVRSNKRKAGAEFVDTKMLVMQSPETSCQEELPTGSGTNPKTDPGEVSWRRSHLSSLKQRPQIPDTGPQDLEFLLGDFSLVESVFPHYSPGLLFGCGLNIRATER